MSDKVQLIKQEIERRFNDNMKASEQYTENSKSRALFTSAAKEDYDLLAFIDSLSEEHFNYNNATIASKDFGELPKETLDEAAVRTHIELEESGNLSFINTFSKGAEWQKQQMKEVLQTEYEKGRFDMREEMMKDAVGGVVHHFADDEVAAVHYNDTKGTPMSIYVSSKELSAGDKVKIIIIKEN
jgi:hypothetical protein